MFYVWWVGYTVTGNSSTVFGYFSNMSTVSGMFNWFGICLTSIRFRQGLKVRPLDAQTTLTHG